MSPHAGLRKYLLIVLLIAIAALLASYGLWTSDAWYWAFGAKAFGEGARVEYRNVGGILEGIRIVLLCFLFYVLGARLFPEAARYAWGRGVLPRRLLVWTGSNVSRLALFLWIVSVLFMPLYHAWIAPADLAVGFGEGVLSKVSLPETPAFERYYLPYLAYMPYSVATYLMLAIPFMLMLVIAIAHDRRKLRMLLKRIRRQDESSPSKAALHLRVQMDYIYENLRRVMNRYGWVLLLLAIYYGIEFFTPMYDTLSCMAQASTSWSAWLFALVIVPYFFIRTYQRFSRGGEEIRRVVDRLKRKAAADEDSDGLDEIAKVEDRLQPDSLAGYLSLLRRTSVVLIVTLLMGVGLVGALAKRLYEGKEIRETVNRVLPPGLDYGTIWLIDLFSSPPADGEAYGYQTCFENPAPPTAVAQRFSQRQDSRVEREPAGHE